MIWSLPGCCLSAAHCEASCRWQWRQRGGGRGSLRRRHPPDWGRGRRERSALLHLPKPCKRSCLQSSLWVLFKDVLNFWFFHSTKVHIDLTRQFKKNLYGLSQKFLQCCFRFCTCMQRYWPQEVSKGCMDKEGSVLASRDDESELCRDYRTRDCVLMTS